MIQIFTDGSSRGNPGRGGYGIVMISGIHRKELAQGYRKTTNNRMELLAVIVALETIKIENANV
jgi:ribonuclease HI